MLQKSYNGGTISFETEDQITVFELNKFLRNLMYAYASVHTFQELTDQFDHPSDLNHLKKSHKATIGELRKIVESKVNLGESTVAAVKNALANTFPLLRVVSININSPGQFTFFGDLNPLNFIKDMYRVYKREERLEEEHKLRRKIAKKEQKRKDEIHKLEKKKMEQSIEMNELLLTEQRMRLVKLAEEDLKGLSVVSSELMRPVRDLMVDSPKFKLKD